MNPNSIYNTGIVEYNVKHWAENEPRTIIVMGLSRSGTSFITSLLEGLGIHMGNNKSHGSLEASEVFKLIEQEHFDRSNFESLVIEKNSKYCLWGWKRPESYKYLDRFKDLLSNPLFIVPFRDILAISQRNHLVTGIDTIKAMKANNKRYQDLLTKLEDLKDPVMLISNEKAVNDMTYLILRIASFIGKEISLEQIPSIIENTKYRGFEYYNTLVKGKQF